MSPKLRGTKRVRFNAVLDHLDAQRMKRQSKLRGLSQADTLRRAIDLLENDYETSRAVIVAATTPQPNPVIATDGTGAKP